MVFMQYVDTDDDRKPLLVVKDRTQYPGKWSRKRVRWEPFTNGGIKFTAVRNDDYDGYLVDSIKFEKTVKATLSGVFRPDVPIVLDSLEDIEKLGLADPVQINYYWYSLPEAFYKKKDEG